MTKNKVFTGVMVALLVGVLAFSGPILTVHASSGVSQDGTPPVQDGPRPSLSARLALEQEWLSRQAENITKMGMAVAKIQTRIDQIKARGLDTSALEAALAEYNSQLPEINTAHESAVQILSSHAGFDDAGAVSDAVQAKATLTSARTALNDARTKMIAARQALRQALQDFKAANPPQPRPTATP
ncbi:MAG: hypothetical protein AB9897_06620 [Anaerolineaceae bacterium]